MESEDISKRILDVFYMVHRKLGGGFLEKIYENAMKIEFDKMELRVEKQYPIKVFYEGSVVGDYITDFLVEDKIVVEVKAKSAFSSKDKAQLINYLVVTKKKIGLLLNFGDKAEVKRFVY